jgi:AraC family transcriptional regulator
MDVQIVTFPETRVASIAHRGSPRDEHTTALKLVAWKRERGLLDQALHRAYVLNYTDPRSVAPGAHHVEFCLAIDGAGWHRIRTAERRGSDHRRLPAAPVMSA